jgi:hypothetical protein
VRLANLGQHQNLGHAREWSKAIKLLRKPLLRANDKKARHSETLDQAAQGLPLQWGLEIGEGDIAAKDEIEGAVWRFRA